jgi:hypothetical protein
MAVEQLVMLLLFTVSASMEVDANAAALQQQLLPAACCCEFVELRLSSSAAATRSDASVSTRTFRLDERANCLVQRNTTRHSAAQQCTMLLCSAYLVSLCMRSI